MPCFSLFPKEYAAVIFQYVIIGPFFLSLYANKRPLGVGNQIYDHELHFHVMKVESATVEMF